MRVYAAGVVPSNLTGRFPVRGSRSTVRYSSAANDACWPHTAFANRRNAGPSQTPANPMNSHHKSGESSLRVLSHLARNRIPY
ncbi:hypothetical protein J2W46_000755 [Paraburkholderia strydomiana]|nr:hypothetical protein [Paraburkholderia strydomiana]